MASSKELKVKISAEEDASRAFKQVATAATALSKALQEAGQEGSEGFERVEQGAEKAAQGFLKVDEAGSGAIRTIGEADDAATSAADSLIQMGVGLQSATDGLSDWSQSARDQQQQIIGLRSAFGEFGDEMIQFSDQMASRTIFNDDDILAGERYFATLKNNYDLSMSQIKDLMQTTADLASAAGVSFEDASSRVTAAIRGEGEAAEYLGLTMNQQSIDRENLTLTMSNQEAAQFRLNALNEQAAAYQGNAAKVAASSVGDFAAVTNTIQDMSQAVGGVIGPWASFASMFGRGLATVGEAARGIREITTGLSGLNSAARGSQTVMTALSAVASPLGLAITGIGLALGVAGIAWLNHKQKAEETKRAWQEAAQSAKALDDQILNLYGTGNAEAGEWASRTNDMAQGFYTSFKNDLQKAAEGDDPQWFTDLVSDSIADRGWNAEGGAIVEMRKELYEQLAPTPEDETAFNQAVGKLFDLSTNPYIDQDAFRAGTEQLFKDIFTGIESGDIKSFDELIGKIEEYRKQVLTTAQDTQAAWDDINLAFKMDDLRLNGMDAVADDLEQFTSLMDEATRASQAYATSASVINTMGGSADHGMYQNLAQDLALTADEQKKVAAAQEHINQVMQSGKIDNDAMNAAVMDLVHQYELGAITGTQFADGMIDLASNTDRYATSATKAAEAQKRFNTELATMLGHPDDAKNPWSTDDIEAYNKTLQDTQAEALRVRQLLQAPDDQRDLVQARQRIDLLQEAWVTQEELNDAQTEGARTGDYSKYIDLGNKRLAQMQLMLDLQNALNRSAADDARPDNPHQYPAAQAQALLDTEEQRKAMAEGVTAAIEKQREAYQGMFESFAGYQGLDSRTMAFGMSSFADEAARAGINMQSVQSGLETTFRIVVENTNGVSELAGKTLDWAEGLIGAEGSWGEIDRLLADGLITQQQYADAQAAYNEIAQSTADIQDYTYRIQTQQAPLIARQTEALENQYEIIANMNDEQQLAALGWMDSAESAKALEINAMAADVAAGKMGASGKAGFEDMLRSAVLLDPALGAMLDKMGLIELAADGTTILKINYDAATGAESEIAKLTDSINALILALGGIPPLDVDTVGLMTAEQRVKALQAAWDQLTADEKQTFFDKLGQGADSSSGKLQRTADDVKRLNDAIVSVGEGKSVEVDTTAAEHNLQSVADHFRELNGSHAQTGVTVETGDADGALQSIRDQLEPLDGKTVETRVKVLIDDAGGMSKYDQSGPGGGLPTISMQGRVTDIVFDGMDKYDQGGSAGPVVPMKGKVTDVSWDAEGLGDAEKSIDVKAKVTDVDTSAIDDAGTGKEITISVVADVAQAVVGLYNVQTQADTLNSTPVELVVNADLGTVQGDLDTLNNTPLDDKTLTLYGDATIALAAVDNVNSATLTDKTVMLYGDATIALGAIANVNNEGLADKTVMLYGDATIALGAIDNVNNAVLEDKTMTITVNTVYTTTGTPASRHGGIPAYAKGGVLFEAGEAGPELATFANGGTAILPTHGYYMAPPATVITPANATPAMAGRGPLVHIDQIVIGAGADPAMADVVADRVMLQLERAVEQRYRSAGVQA